MLRVTYFLTVCTTAFSVGCQHQSQWPASSFSVADPSVVRQLVSGFYEVNDNRWRWTAPSFTVAFRPPNLNYTQPLRPARLTVSLYFPQAEIDQLGPITLTASGAEDQFGQTTYNAGGSHTFVADLPARALCTNVLPVTFSLNKSFHGSGGDARSLGMVVNSFSLKEH